MQILSSEPKLIEVQQTLSKRAYFSLSSLPGHADAKIFKMLLQNKKYPNKKMHANFFHWYVIMKQFSTDALDQWIKQKLYANDQSDKWVETFKEIFKKNQQISIKNNSTNLSSSFSHSRCNHGSKYSEKPHSYQINLQKEKTEFTMMVKLKNVEHLENLTAKLYSLRLKIKQLRFNKAQKSALIRFIAQQDLFASYQQQIQTWEDIESFRVNRKRSDTIMSNSRHQGLTVSV